MKYSYFPGCTLKTKAKDLEKFAVDSANVLGIVLEEQKEWQCCGAIYPLSKDEIATKLSSVRSLARAQERSQKLVTLCTACHHVIKRVNEDMKTDDNIRKKVNNYLQLPNEYSGEGEVYHFIEIIKDEIGFDNLSKMVKKPLTGRKIGAYYGCLLLRPSNVMNFDDPENPSVIEEFIKALGATPIKYPYRTECCGGYHSLDKKNISKEMSLNVISSANNHKVEEIVTACPLCKYNLEISDEESENKITISYFTELLAEALGVK